MPFPDRAAKIQSPRMQRPAALGMRQVCLPPAKYVCSPGKASGSARTKKCIADCPRKCIDLPGKVLFPGTGS